MKKLKDRVQEELAISVLHKLVNHVYNGISTNELCRMLKDKFGVLEQYCCDIVQQLKIEMDMYFVLIGSICILFRFRWKVAAEKLYDEVTGYCKELLGEMSGGEKGKGWKCGIITIFPFINHHLNAFFLLLLVS